MLGLQRADMESAPTEIGVLRHICGTQISPNSEFRIPNLNYALRITNYALKSLLLKNIIKQLLRQPSVLYETLFFTVNSEIT